MADYLFFGSWSRRLLIFGSKKIELIGVAAPGDFFDAHQPQKWYRVLASTRGKFHPLYSPSAIRAAFALPDEERINNRVGFDLMNLLCPRLTNIPFAEKSWSPSLLGDPPPPVTEGSLLKIRAEPPVNDKNVNAHRRATIKEIIDDFRVEDRSLETISSTFDVEEARKAIAQVGKQRVSARAEATACRILGAYAWMNGLDLPFRA